MPAKDGTYTLRISPGVVIDPSDAPQTPLAVPQVLIWTPVAQLLWVVLVLLTLLGAAGESLGMDRHLKSNTVKTRSHSLFRQGSMLYDLIPNMPEHRLKPLVDRFAELLQQSRAFTETFALT